MLVLKVKDISLPYIFQVLYVLCFTGPRYQVSVYRTIGPLVIKHLLLNRLANQSQIYVEPPWEVGKKAYINGTGHMTKMVAMLIYGKNFQKSSTELIVL